MQRRRERTMSRIHMRSLCRVEKYCEVWLHETAERVSLRRAINAERVPPQSLSLRSARCTRRHDVARTHAPHIVSPMKSPPRLTQ
jgi:hypothetical protein